MDSSGPCIHPTALVESHAVGAGTVIWAFAHVMPGAVIGRECKIGDHVFIESDVTLGDHVTVKNGVSIWKHVRVGDRVFLGPNAVLTNDRYPRAGAEPYLLLTAIRLGYVVREVPVSKVYPPPGRPYTKMRPFTDWWSILRPVVLLGLGLRR